MSNSIHHSRTDVVKNLEKVFDDYSDDLTKMAELVQGVRENILEIGCQMIAEELEFYDNWLKDSSLRKKNWYVVRTDETTLLTSIGNVTYHKTLFRDRQTGRSEYLLDRVMGLEKHARMTEDAQAAALEEAVESSYRKGGDHASISMEGISKTAVMNKIHALSFPPVNMQGEKKVVPFLYIDADEDHVPLQYMEKKGDIGKSDRRNTVMPKIVYVYEGIEDENGRHRLVNGKYFGGVYEGTKENGNLWKEVNSYIEAAYDTEILQRVYVNGDGAAWIKGGAEQVIKGKFVLDKFHMNKYILSATAHLLDSKEDARSELYRAVHKKNKRMAEETFEKILAVTPEGTKQKAVERAQTYILSNWAGIMEQVKNRELECSAEGHVSHIYADRMSSRPLGWSRVGADKMARLRIYHANGGDMLSLVRYQKMELPKAAGAEETIFSSGQMRAMENRNREKLGSLADMHTYSIPYQQVRKIAGLKNQIWGL